MESEGWKNKSNNSITIELFGQSFKFEAESQTSNAKEIAEFLTQKVNNVENRLPDKSSNNTKFVTLLLAALNISNDYFELQKNHSELLIEFAKRSSTVIKLLNKETENQNPVKDNNH